MQQNLQVLQQIVHHGNTEITVIYSANCWFTTAEKSEWSCSKLWKMIQIFDALVIQKILSNMQIFPRGWFSYVFICVRRGVELTIGDVVARAFVIIVARRAARLIQSANGRMANATIKQRIHFGVWATVSLELHFLDQVNPLLLFFNDRVNPLKHIHPLTIVPFHACAVDARSFSLPQVMAIGSLYQIGMLPTNRLNRFANPDEWTLVREILQFSPWQSCNQITWNVMLSAFLRPSVRLCCVGGADTLSSKDHEDQHFLFQNIQNGRAHHLGHNV